MWNKKLTPQQILNEVFDWNSALITSWNEWDIANWDIPWKSIMYAFWEREWMGEIATWEDIWRGTATTIPIPDSAWEQMTIVSTSANDIDWGTWVRTVDIHYIDTNGDEQEEMITLDWTTEVDTTATDIRFVNGFHTATVWSNWVAEWEITIYKKWSASTIYNMIELGWNMSLVPNRMIPRAKTLILKNWHCEEAQDKRVVFRIRSTDHEWELYPWVFLFKDVAYIRKTATWNMPLDIKIPAFSIIKVSGRGDQAWAEWSCGWSGILIDD